MGALGLITVACVGEGVLCLGLSWFRGNGFGGGLVMGACCE
jgi:hypothetical protein